MDVVVVVAISGTTSITVTKGNAADSMRKICNWHVQSVVFVYKRCVTFEDDQY